MRLFRVGEIIKPHNSRYIRFPWLPERKLQHVQNARACLFGMLRLELLSHHIVLTWGKYASPYLHCICSYSKCDLIVLIYCWVNVSKSIAYMIFGYDLRLQNERGNKFSSFLLHVRFSSKQTYICNRYGRWVNVKQICFIATHFLNL